MLETKDTVLMVATLLAFAVALFFVALVFMSCGESVTDDGDDDDTSTWDDWEWDGSTGDEDTGTGDPICDTGLLGYAYCWCETLPILGPACVYSDIGGIPTVYNDYGCESNQWCCCND